MVECYADITINRLVGLVSKLIWSISGKVQNFKYDKMMHSNAFMAIDVRATGLR